MGKQARLKRERKKQSARADISRKRPVIADKGSLAIACALVAIVTIAVYWQVHTFEFTNMDDQVYVYANPDVRNGLTLDTIQWAFRYDYMAGNWHPLTWISHMADVELFGQDAAGMHHVSSATIHIAASILLLMLFSMMTGSVWRSAFVAAAFALHPQHVESVAWVAERKDVLSGLFWITTSIVYVWYTDKPSLLRYFLIIISYALGLMSKPMLVSLPLILILLDIWPLKRIELGWKRLLKEKIPLFIMAIGSSIITIIAQKSGSAIASINVIGLSERISNAIMSYAIYLSKTFVPTNLACYYPRIQDEPWSLGLVLPAIVFLTILTFMAIRYLRSYPFFTVGWLWYVITLIPVIGLVQVGSQLRADRYTYIPLIGIFIILAWGVPELVAKLNKDRKTFLLRIPAVFGVIAIVSLIYPTYIQIGYWKNSFTVYSRCLEVTRKNWFAHNGLGCAYEDKADLLLNSGKTEEARALYEKSIEHFKEVIKIMPALADAHSNLGKAYAAIGRDNEAIEAFKTAILINPNHALAHNNLAGTLSRIGRNDEALKHYLAALKINPKYVDAHYNIAILYFSNGNFDSAIEHYFEAIALQPRPYIAYWARRNVALLVAQKGRKDEAIKLLEEAVLINESTNVDKSHIAKSDLDALQQGKYVAPD